jgi:hypothetical protein
VSKVVVPAAGKGAEVGTLSAARWRPMGHHRAWSRLVGVPAALLACACGAPTAGVTSAPTTQGSPPRTWAAVGSTLLEAARAVVAAARGEPHLPQWNCDSSPDLRATTPGDRAKLAKRNPREAITEVLVRVVDLESPALPPSPRGPGFDWSKPIPQEWVSLGGHLMVRADGHVAWSEVHAYDKRLGGDTVDVSELPPELLGAMDAFTRQLATPSCDVPMITQVDIDLSPFDEATRAIWKDRLQYNRGDVQYACAKMARATGPWRLGMREIFVGLGRAPAVLLRSKIVLTHGGICLGPAEVTLPE